MTRQTAKKTNYNAMKEASKILNRCEAWTKADRKNRTAAIIMSDAVQKEVYLHYAGSSRDMAHLVTDLMNSDKEFGHDIFAAAMVYAQKHIEQSEIDRVTLVAKTIAEVRKEQKGEAE